MGDMPKPTVQLPLPEEILNALVVVLAAIRLGGARTRTEIAVKTGLTRAVVGPRVAELIEHGLVEETGTAPSTGGRPARQLFFRAAVGRVLVADLGATSIDVALTDLSGRILDHLAEPADIAAGPETILGRVETLFDELLTEADPSHELWGLGIGVPGPVEFNTGRPISPPIMPGWDGYPVRERFAQKYRAPVWVDNDVNVMALGEWRHGIADGHPNVVFVKIGTGIGAGLISDGLMHRGAQGSAGDVGHIQILDDPTVICRCGNVGCLEAVAGGAAIAREGAALAASGQSPQLASVAAAGRQISAIDVSRAAGFGDGASLALLQSSGRRVGAMLASVVNFFNPSLIVIGGGVANSGDGFLAAIRETVYRRSLPLATRHLLIQRSSLAGLAGVLGASAMVVDELLSLEVLERWIEQGSPAGLVDPVPEEDPAAAAAPSRAFARA